MEQKKRKIFLVIDGFDGVGKSSQIKFIDELMKEAGYETVVTREPGGSEVAEKIRHLALSEKMPPTSQLLMMWAARFDHIQNVIKPALEAGKVVICDRFHFSTMAYNAAPNNLLYLNDFIVKNCLDVFPTHTFFFNAEFETCIKRLQSSGKIPDVFETLDLESKRVTYDTYQTMLAFNKRMWEIDCNKTIGEVEDQLRYWVDVLFKTAEH